jgi:hypothetical protein
MQDSGTGGSTAHETQSDSGVVLAPAPVVLRGATLTALNSAPPEAIEYHDFYNQPSVVTATPGQVFLLMDPAVEDGSGVADLVQQQGASLFAQIPAAGEYWVKVTPGQEDTFLTAANLLAGWAAATPDVPVTVSADVVDLSGATSLTPISLNGAAIAQFDSFAGVDHCGSHGAEVQAFLTENGLTVGAYGIGSQSTDPVFGLARVAAGAAAEGHRLVVNMSLQSLAEPNDEVDRSACEMDVTLPQCISGTCAHGKACNGTYSSWKAAQFVFMAQIAALIQHMEPNTRDNTLLVLSAGNSGMNLSSEIAVLTAKYPDAMQHMLIVSSSGAGPGQAHNFSPFAGEVLYAPGFGVAVPGQTMCAVDGTSFAAPQVANLAARLAQQFPTLTTAQLVSVIYEAAKPGADGGLAIPLWADATAAAQRLSVQAGSTQGTGGQGNGGQGNGGTPGITGGDTGFPPGGGGSPGTAGGGVSDAGVDNRCCACNFDVYCTVFGAGGCWYCSNSTYDAQNVCIAPQNYLSSPGPCACDPTIYQVCQ